MWDWVRIAGWSVVSALKSQRDLALENVALRHPLMVLQRQSGRARLQDRDRLAWICLRRLWHGWTDLWVAKTLSAAKPLAFLDAGTGLEKLTTVSG